MIAHGTERGVRSVEALLEVLEDDLELTPPFAVMVGRPQLHHVRTNEDFPASLIEAKAKYSSRDRAVVVEICTDLSAGTNVRTGTYEGHVPIRDPRFHADSVALRIEVKDRGWHWALLAAVGGGLVGALWGSLSAAASHLDRDAFTSSGSEGRSMVIRTVAIASLIGVVVGCISYAVLYVDQDSFEGTFTARRQLGMTVFGTTAVLHTVVAVLERALRALKPGSDRPDERATAGDPAAGGGAEEHEPPQPNEGDRSPVSAGADPAAVRSRIGRLASPRQLLIASTLAIGVASCASPVSESRSVEESGGVAAEDGAGSLRGRCTDGDLVACDDLALASVADSDDETFGRTCGDRVDRPQGSCLDLLGGQNGTPDAPDAPDVPDARSATPEVFSRNTEARSSAATGAAPGRIVDVRVARQNGFDRVVLEFEFDGRPGYEVGYSEPGQIQLIIDDPGLELDLASVAEQIEPGLDSTIRQLRLIGGGTDQPVFVIDVDGQPGFETLELDGPSRLVIDVSQL